MKTRTYLVLMAAAILLPTIVFSWVGLDMLLVAERESRLRGVQETGRVLALSIDEEIAAAEAALGVLSHSRFIQNDDFRGLHDVMSAAYRSSNSWTVLSDHAARPLVNTLVPFGTQLPDLQGTWAGTWAAGAIDSNKPTVSNYFVGELYGKATVSVNVPVPKVTGKAYVLSQVFNAAYFAKAFKEQNIPSTWIAGVFGSDGITILRNRNPEQFVGKPVHDAILNASRQNYSGVVRHLSRDNIDIYDVFTHTQRTGWTVAIGVPAEEIEAPARRAAIYAASGLAAAFALAAMAAIFLASRLSRSLDGAVRSAEALGQGHIPRRESSLVHEVDLLQAALYEAGQALATERASRSRLEQERERLLCGEQQARKHAEAQNKAKDAFLAMLGHELRNPLGAISSAISILEIGNATPAQVSRAREIARRQTSHLARILDDLLDVGRIMAGKIILNCEPVALSELVRRCVESQRLTDHVRHGWTLDIGEAWVMGDATRLEQVVGNILTNAVKYTPEDGDIHVSVGVDRNTAVVMVTDTGIGIPADMLQQIFDVFVQGPISMDRAQGGLGLGLALVRQLMELHQGSVTAFSAGEGQGSTFTLRIPCIDAPVHEKASGNAGMVQSARRRILVVEDNDDGRDMLATMLALQGFDVVAARDAMEALQKIDAATPDAAVLDIGLPSISGYELAKRLRSNPATSTIRLVALTGYGLPQDRERAADAGFDAHLTKPYAVSRLLEALSQVSTSTL